MLNFGERVEFKWLNMLMVKRSGDKKALKGNGDALDRDEKL